MSTCTKRSLGMLVGFLVILSGCGNSSGGEQTGSQLDDTQPTSAVSDPGTDPSQVPARVSSSETSLGTVLANGDGFTLYIFTKDLTNTPSCYGDCIILWPPLLTDGVPEAGDGIDSSELGIATRHDGTFQATYFGRPLYLYSGDSAPGHTLGHGIEDLWQVLLPTGELLDKADQGTSDDGSSVSDGEEYNPDDSY